MSGHNFQQSNCTNQVVVVIKQWFLYTFGNCFQSSKVNDSIKSVIKRANGDKTVNMLTNGLKLNKMISVWKKCITLLKKILFQGLVCRVDPPADISNIENQLLA